MAALSSSDKPKQLKQQFCYTMEQILKIEKKIALLFVRNLHLNNQCYFNVVKMFLLFNHKYYNFLESDWSITQLRINWKLARNRAVVIGLLTEPINNLS